MAYLRRILYPTSKQPLENPPTLSPRPEFAKLQALQKHMVKALQQLVCLQSAIHRWSGMVLPPMVYALLKPNTFVKPGHPGLVAMYL
jgi:hypothetical protein